MAAVVIRPLRDDDLDAVVALNAGEVRHTSVMDRMQLEALAALSIDHRVATVDGEVVGMLLAMRAGCGYVNDNFAWFAVRHERFVYIDRIVVARGHQGRSIGRRLYAQLFDTARADDMAMVCCEYNLMPPNDASRAFHDGLGFREVGTRTTVDGSKVVSMQAAEVGQHHVDPPSV